MHNTLESPKSLSLRSLRFRPGRMLRTFLLDCVFHASVAPQGFALGSSLRLLGCLPRIQYGEHDRLRTPIVLSVLFPFSAFLLATRATNNGERF